MKAYGAGNDHNVMTVKAGPGTIYLLEGKSPKEVFSLVIIGDADSPIQEQTYTYISGNTGEFKYNLLTLSGNISYDSLLYSIKKCNVDYILFFCLTVKSVCLQTDNNVCKILYFVVTNAGTVSCSKTKFHS
jgi:hypothetical protein